jgi:hypothetical protein
MFAWLVPYIGMDFIIRFEAEMHIFLIGSLGWEGPLHCLPRGNRRYLDWFPGLGWTSLFDVFLGGNQRFLLVRMFFTFTISQIRNVYYLIFNIKSYVIKCQATSTVKIMQ